MKQIKLDHKESFKNSFDVDDKRNDVLALESAKLVGKFFIGEITKSELVEQLYNMGENKKEALYIVSQSMYSLGVANCTTSSKAIPKEIHQKTLEVLESLNIKVK